MKHIAFITLLALAATHSAALADDEKKGEKQRARYNAAVAKMVARGSGQGRQVSQRPQVQRSVPNVSDQSSLRRNQGEGGNRDFRGEGRRNRTFTPRIANVDQSPRVPTTPTAPVITPTQQAEVSQGTVRGGNEGRRNRRNRGNWTGNNNESGNWRNDGNDGDGNRDWRNRDGDGNRNWRNNDGNNNNWSNRSDRWRRRHGNWNRGRQNRSWYRNNFTRFALFGGGYYYWNSGYWYPAYGYDPYYSNYTYDAPIYAYNDQNPGEVVANVQSELERRGYDTGGVDGTYGPATRSALIRYQSENGLEPTGEIDEDTLSSLGLQ